MDDRRDDSEDHFAELIGRVTARSGRFVAFEDWRALARLYRIHSGRLAGVQTQARDPDRVRHLNSLCVRAYTLLYAAPQRRSRRGSFLLSDLPAALGSTWRVQLLVAGLMLAAAIVGAALSAQGPRASAAIVPQSMYPADALERLATSPAAREKFLARDEVATSDKSFFSAYLFVHNTRVGLLGFATGVLLAVPTLVLVLYNGLMLGAFASIFLGTEQAPTFWAWLVPHAIPELLAIVLCSTGGVLMGRAVLAPGRRGRRQALVDAARTALQLALGAIPLFVAAALIESFVRQSTLSSGARFGVAALAVASLLGYWLWVGALARRQQADVDLSFLTHPLTADPPPELRGIAPASGP